MKHRFSSLLRALILPALCLLCAIPTRAAENVTIDNIDYILDSGIATVSGASSLKKSSNFYEITIPSYINYGGSSYYVYKISNSAFSDHTKLTKISIPNSISDIGEYAFKNCTALTELTIPASVYDVRAYLCQGSGIKKLVLEASSIELRVYKNAFVNGNIEEVYIGRNLYLANTSTEPFKGLNIKKMTIGPRVTILGDANPFMWNNDDNKDYRSGFFQLNSLEELRLEYGTTALKMEQKTIDTCPVKTLYVDRTLENTSPSTAPLSKCSQLKTITFGSNITTVQNKFFTSCYALTSVNFSPSIRTISSGAFNNCTSLETLVIPNTIMNIQGDLRCSALHKVVIEDGDTPISIDTFTFGENLTDLYVGRNITNEGVIFYSYTISSQGTSVEHTSKLKTLTFGPKVTSIGNSIFWKCHELTQVMLPSALVSLGHGAFAETGLTQIEFPETLTTIGDLAFKGCSSIKSVSIPSSVASIGENAFTGCSINNLIIDDSETALNAKNSTFAGNPVASLYLGRNADLSFVNSETLSSVTFGDDVTTVADNAFSNCKLLTEIALPHNLSSIGTSAFSGCNGLTQLALPATLQSVGNSAFSSCDGIKTLSIPASVNSIGENAFADCSIADLTIANSENALNAGNDAFAGNPVASLYLGRDANLSFADSETLSSVTFGDNVTTVADNVFSNCKLLTEITLPHNLSSIGTSAFSGCNGLTQLALPASLQSVGNSAFSSCDGIKTLSIPASVNSIGENAFADCSIADLTIANSEDALNAGNDAFAGNPVASLYLGRNADLSFADSETLSSVTFGDDVTTVADNAFSNCKLLTEITLPQNLTSIGNSAFNGCTGIEALSIPASVNSIGENAFADCSIADLTIANSEDALNAGNDAFAGNPVASLYLGRNTDLSFADSETLSSVTFGDNVTTVAPNAFSNCKLLTEITLPQNLASIGNSAFSGCNGLTQLALPASLQSVGELAFDGCTGIEGVKVDAVTPPSAAPTSFAPETYSSAPLTVPEEAASDYRLHDVWSLFANGNHLEGNDDDENISGIGSVTDYDENEIVEVYNLSGTMVARSVKNLLPGFYIVKDGSTTRKVRI